MGRYRKIDPRIHNDAKFKALSERGKLLFFTILTHPHMTALGAMRATEAGLCEEMALSAPGRDAGCAAGCTSDCATGCATGCASDCSAGRAAGVFESYRQAFRDLVEKGLIKFDPANACLVIPKFLKYNPPESPSVVTAWNAAGDLIPECDLRDELIENTINFLQGYGKPSFLEAFSLRPLNRKTDGQTAPQTDGQGGAQQEQEQEQELNTPPTPHKGGDAVGGKGGKKPKKTIRRKAGRQLPAYSPEFEQFYKTYPNPSGSKEKAWAIWLRRQERGILPPFDYLMECLQKLIHSPKWQEEDGKFIPMVTTFLNAGRWTDADALQSSKGPTLNQSDPNCKFCQGRGHEPTEKDGVKGYKTCRCRRQ